MALTDNIQHYWKFDGNSNDAVGSLNGTDANITYSNANGIINNGAGCNGSSSDIAMSSATLGITNSWTINVWVKTSTFADTQRFFKAIGGSNNDNIMFTATSNAGNNNWRVEIEDQNFSGNGHFKQYEFVTALSGAFHMLTATYDGSALSGFVDAGAITPIKTTDNAVTMSNSSRTIHFGSDGGTNFYTGAVDEQGMWARVLSGSEITQLYAGGAGLQYPFGGGATLAAKKALLGVGI